jgi:hypothetical protein
MTQEAPVMFGHVKSQIYMDIYNTRISYPTAMILLGLADVNSLTAKSVLAGEKLVATYSIST